MLIFSVTTGGTVGESFVPRVVPRHVECSQGLLVSGLQRWHVVRARLSHGFAGGDRPKRRGPPGCEENQELQSKLQGTNID